jgi:hypothetical protein
MIILWSSKISNIFGYNLFVFWDLEFGAYL